MSNDQPMPDIAQLVGDYHRPVYRYAFRLAGSSADAEDLTQQTFLLAQEKSGQLRKPESARSWLFAILRNCYLKSRRQMTPLSAGSLELDIDSVPAAVPQESVIDGELLQETLDQLPDKLRLVLVMYYFEDCSYKEIAEKLELPIGTVMSRLARAKSHLRSKLFTDDQPAASEKAPSGAN